MSTNTRTLRNTSDSTHRVLGEVLLRPDFDPEFSTTVSTATGGPHPDLDGIGPSALGDSYGAPNKNGREMYQPQIGSFFIDCSLVTPGGNPCSIYNPALIQVPLIEGGFGRFASSSFTPAQFGIQGKAGVGGSVPSQQSYKDTFNKPNPLRFQNNSIELTYTTIINTEDEFRNNSDAGRTQHKHKMLVSSWSPYGMDRLTTDADGNIVLENDLNITYHSALTKAYDSSGYEDNDFDVGGINSEFYDPPEQESQLDYGFTNFATNPSILDGEILSGGYSQPNGFQPVYNPDYFFAPRVRVSSGFNPSPRYLQLTPIFEFFVVAPHVFVKGHYKIY